MAKRTKKAGVAGKFGVRYGVVTRKKINSVSKNLIRPQVCPECDSQSLHRNSSGIWECKKCGLVYAAGAYSPKVRPYRKVVTASLEERVGLVPAEQETKEETE